MPNTTCTNLVPMNPVTDIKIFNIQNRRFEFCFAPKPESDPTEYCKARQQTHDDLLNLTSLLTSFSSPYLPAPVAMWTVQQQAG